jgi:hypothetical protein
LRVDAVIDAERYQWSYPAGAVLVGNSDSNVISLNWDAVAPGTYNVCVNASNDCGVSVDQCIKVVIGDIQLSAVPTHVSCHGTATGSIALTVSGGREPYSFAWSNGANIEDPTQLAAGTYRVVVTDYVGCKDSIDITITEPAAALNASNEVVVNENPVPSANGSISLSIGGGTAPYTYSWSGPSSYSATTEDISNLSGGTYTLTVTDAKGCQLTKVYTVDKVGAVLALASITPTPVNCASGNDGAINLEIMGGTAPFTYAWSNGANTQDLSGLTAGTYNVTVTDALNATIAASAVVTAPATALSSSSTKTNVLCAGSNTGAINVSVSGGTSPYTYRWSNGANTEDLNQLSAGIYVLTITDAKGCTLVHRDTLGQPDTLQFATVIANNVCGSTLTGGIELTVTGGTAPYTYLWSNGSTAQHLSGVAAGNYSVVVTDANGCAKSADYTISYSCLGTAKSVAEGPVNNRNGSYSLAYDILVKNLGQTILSDVQIVDNLTNTFTAPATYVVDSLLSPV